MRVWQFRARQKLSARRPRYLCGFGDIVSAQLCPGRGQVALFSQTTEDGRTCFSVRSGALALALQQGTVPAQEDAVVIALTAEAADCLIGVLAVGFDVRKE
jgi:hypothetical protein